MPRVIPSEARNLGLLGIGCPNEIPLFTSNQPLGIS